MMMQPGTVVQFCEETSKQFLPLGANDTKQRPLVCMQICREANVYVRSVIRLGTTKTGQEIVATLTLQGWSMVSYHSSKYVPLEICQDLTAGF